MSYISRFYLFQLVGTLFVPISVICFSLLQFLEYFFVGSGFMPTFAALNQGYYVMDAKKVTYEEALARLQHSLEVKRKAKQRMAEAWALEGLTGTVVSL